MGQKTHPLGFRLGTTQAHKSTWYSNFNQYAKILKEDDTIRTYIKTISKAKSISNVRINRNGLNDQIQLNQLLRKTLIKTSDGTDTLPICFIFFFPFFCFCNNLFFRVTSPPYNFAVTSFLNGDILSEAMIVAPITA